MTDSSLIWKTALELRGLIDDGELSAVEVMQAHYDQIDKVNPTVNAMINVLDREDAIRLAAKADEQQAKGESLGPLHGLPTAVKDLADLAGFPTTYGYRPFADQVADEDALFVARERRAGALFIGKTNAPEFGLGSHTFNALFGATLNPYDTSRTPGGSSGGAAASLACGLLPIADGSDMGGSLRNPASFCNVVGFRPSVGRLPSTNDMGWLARLSTAGPMARTVADTALLFSVQAGPDVCDPLSLEDPGSTFSGPLDRDLKGLKVAFSPDLGGLPVEPAVVEVLKTAVPVFEDLGCHVDAACPDLTGAMDVFQVQRAAAMVSVGRQLENDVENWREFAKDTAIWNIEKGNNLSAADLLDSEFTRARVYDNAVRFFSEYDILIAPVAQVVPFDHTLDWVHEINGQELSTYIDWMAACCVITSTGMPAISVPCGFTPLGLPVGLQIVGKPRGDWELLRVAHAFEKQTRHYQRHPEIAL